jgi:hypothetical protein
MDYVSTKHLIAIVDDVFVVHQRSAFDVCGSQHTVGNQYSVDFLLGTWG